MDKFLDIYTLPRLNQEDVETLNRPITRSEVETATNSLPTKKAQVQTGLQPNSTRCTKRSWYHSFWDYSKQSKKRKSFPNHFETNLILIPKLDRDSTKKKTSGQYP